MDELVEVMLVAGAEVDEGLDGLVWVRGDVLALGTFDNGDHIVNEVGEVGDGIVDVCGFVDTDEGFIEDGEKVAEEFEGYGLVKGQLRFKMSWRKGILTSSITLSIMVLSRCLV